MTIAVMGWSIAFEDPIPLPRGRQLVTLKDGADYIMQLPKAEQDAPEWQAATEALIMAAEGRGPLLHARVGMLRALNRHAERVWTTVRSRYCSSYGTHTSGFMRAFQMGLRWTSAWSGCRTML